MYNNQNKNLLVFIRHCCLFDFFSYYNFLRFIQKSYINLLFFYQIRFLHPMISFMSKFFDIEKFAYLLISTFIIYTKHPF